MDPLVCVRLVHTEKSCVHLLGRSLFQVDQDEEQLVFHLRQRRVFVDAVFALGAGFPRQGLGLDEFLKLTLKVRQ